MAYTKAEVLQQIADMTQQEKQIWANLNFLLGQKSVLESIVKEMPDDPVEEVLPEAPLSVVPDPEPALM